MTCRSCDAPTPEDLLLCTSCIATTTRIVGNTPGILTAMHTTITKQARVQDSSRTGRTLHAPPPANLDAIEKKHHLRSSLVNAALAVGTASGERPPTHLPTQMLAWWLLPKTDWFAYDETTADACGDLIFAYHRAVSAIDHPIERIDIGVCGSAVEDEGGCTERLYPAKGQRTIVCPGCGTVWDVQERREAAFASARNILLPAADVARYLTAIGYRTTPKDVENWVARGKLEASLCDVTRRRQLYRFSDAHDVARRRQEKRARVASGIPTR